MKHQTYIHYELNGEVIARAIRTVENGEINYKYYVEGFKRPVVWKTFIKHTSLNDEEIEMIKRAYWRHRYNDILDNYGIATIVLMSDGASVVLGPWDRFIERIRVNSHFYFDIVSRDEQIFIEASSVDYSNYEDYNSVLAKIGYELYSKYYREVLNIHTNRLNEILSRLKKFKDKLNSNVIVQYVSPTESNPVLQKITLVAQVEDVYQLKDFFDDLPYVVVGGSNLKDLSKEQIVFEV